MQNSTFIQTEYRRALRTRVRTLHRMLNIPTLVVILALVGWMALGSVLLRSCEQQWSTFDSVYFLFNSLTTAGIGDLRVSFKCTIIVGTLIAGQQLTLSPGSFCLYFHRTGSCSTLY